MKVAAFTPGGDVPSARFRVRQFIPHLRALGVTLDEMATRTVAYPPRRRWARPAWGAARLAELAYLSARSHRYDAVMLQREMISSMVTLEATTGRPRILDVDDSIHLARGGKTARRLAELSTRVIAGNAYLADWYRRWNRDVVILPTAVDSERYRPAAATADRETLVIGWIGTSANHAYLAGIEPALVRVVAAHDRVRVRIVSDRPPPFAVLDPARWSFSPWSEEREVADIQSMDIGIMPLVDSEWARGKCSFKMLQYMSCGLPVVVSPVGMNAEVLREGAIGHAARNESEWTDALSGLLGSARSRAAMGAAGRALVERRYATRVLAAELARHLR